MIDTGDNIVEDLPFYGQEIWASHLYRGVIFISIGFKTSVSLFKKEISVLALPICHGLIWTETIVVCLKFILNRALVVL